jgi:hypothetical protein
MKNDIIESTLDESVYMTNESISAIANKTKCGSNLIPSDIVSANVVIGDKFINSTMWFSNPFFVNYPENVAGVTYSMSIVDNSEVSLPLYTLAISWSPNYGWQKTLYQHPLSNNISRHLTPITNYSSNLYGNVSNIDNNKEFGYVDIVLDKTHKITLPDDYNIIFHSLIFDEESCYKLDLFDKIFDVPYVDSFLNSSEKIELRPGEEKTFELHVQSTPGSKPIINFLDVNQSTGIYLDFIQSEVQSNSDGVVFISAKIKASFDIEPHLYTIPIHYNVTTKSFVAYPLIFRDAQVIHIGETEPHQNLDYLTIKILTWAEYSEALLKSYSGLLNLIVTFIVGLIEVYSGHRYYKSKK